MSFFFQIGLFGLRVVMAIIITIRYVPITQLRSWPPVFMAVMND